MHSGGVARDSFDSLVRTAQHNAATGGLRLPLFAIVSSFLVVFINPVTGLVWLAASAVVDRVSVWLRRQVADGRRAYATAYVISTMAISACWVAHALLLWGVGDEMSKIVAIIGLFMVTIYGVTGGHKNMAVLMSLVLPAMGVFLALMIHYLWTSTHPVAAACGTASAIGACVAVLATAISVHRSDRDLHLANQRLKALSEALRVEQRQAQAADVAKGQFVARMSHEIRTPMNGVIGMLEALLRSPLGPDQHDHTETALKSANDLLHVLDDIIDVSQLEERRLSVAAAPFRIADVVGDVAALFAARADQLGLQLETHIDAGAPEWVIGDARRLRQVLTNLVGNALKFTDAGRVDVSVTHDAAAGELRAEVRDTGISVAPSSMAHLFEPFYQADISSTRRHGGSGLGLAICRQLVELMGGRIGVESPSGGGSVFWFTVKAPATVEPEPAVPVSVRAPAETRPLRILVAEDNLTSQKILSALLSLEGHALTFVEDGQAAVALAASKTFDVILMDVMMPVMDGPTAARRIRELGGRASGVPIIALTANALMGDRDSYFAAGMTDYLAKPIDVTALFNALARAAALVE